MNREACIYVNYNNIVVLQTYLDVIRTALESIGYNCSYVKSLKGVPRKTLIVFPMGIDAFKFYFEGFHNFILWQQGVTAEESFLRNKSRMRYKILNYIDCFVMKRAKIIFFCSAYMREHYEKILGCSLSAKSYLMPCYNEKFNPNSIKQKDYTKKTFAYVGSLDLWQCFDKILKIYKNIEQVYPNAVLKVLTFSVDEAVKKIKSLGISHYSVKSVKKEEVQQELKEVVYGFVIREDSEINRVATPTKLSSYLSVGVIPIFSEVLNDFMIETKEMKYVISMKDTENLDFLIKKISEPIDKNELEVEYEKIFGTYYCPEHHVINMVKLMEGVI